MLSTMYYATMYASKVLFVHCTLAFGVKWLPKVAKLFHV